MKMLGLDRSYPTLKNLSGYFADWDYSYLSPYEAIESEMEVHDVLYPEMAEDVEKMIAHLDHIPDLIEALSNEFNVRFADTTEIRTFLEAILNRLRS